VKKRVGIYAPLLLSAVLLASVFTLSCRQGNSVKLANVDDSLAANKLVKQIEDLYNDDENDSVYQYSPHVMAFCKEHEQWHQYYYAWTFLAMTYIWDNQPDVAIKEARQMQEEALASNNNYGLSKAYAVLGEAYAAQDNYVEMAHAFHNALDIHKDVHDFGSKNTLYSKYCMALKVQKKYVEMDSVLTRWKAEIAHDSLAEGHQVDIVAHWHYEYQYWLATLLMHNRQYQKAEAAVDSASYYLDISGQSLINLSRQENLRYELAQCKGDYQEALASCNRKMALTPSKTSSNYLAALMNRGKAYEQLGRYKESLADFHEFDSLNNLVRQKDTQKQLNELNKRFEVNKLKAEKERQQMAARQQQLILYMSIASLLVMGLIVYIVLHRRAERRMAALSAQKERMESELRIAHDIQTKMVPSEFPHLEGLDMYASMNPAKEVGGDLYDYLLQDGKLYFCLGDVSGKGVPAALFMTQTVKLFRAIAKQKASPAEMAMRINNELTENNEQGMFVTMFIGCLDMATGHLHFCNCGHNPPVIWESGHECEFLHMKPNYPLGIMPGMEFTGEEVESIRGNTLFIYSDGLNEAENLQQEQFGDTRLLTILSKTRFDTARQIIETLKTEIDTHRAGADPNDDLSMLCLKVGL
jgi:serine phosphatase RsbU (regulator of sigma subunit)